MLPITRDMDQVFFEQSKFLKRLTYALGSLLLVIVGILVALRIDSWYAKYEQNQTLTNYLGRIATDIRGDLGAVADVRARRDEAYDLSMQYFFFVSDEMPYGVPDILLAYRALSQAGEVYFLNANKSGFESLKTSDTLTLLQGGDIERLLFDYYDTVNRIVRAEQDHNAYVRMLSLDVMNGWPARMEESEFSMVDALSLERFQALQPSYHALLRNPKTGAIIEHTRAVGPLLLEYEKLERLGNAYVALFENEAMEFDDQTRAELDDAYDPYSGFANPEIIADGKVIWHSYNLGMATSTDHRVQDDSPDAAREQLIDVKPVLQPDRSIYIDYRGGADWAVVFFTVPGSSEERPNKDFSNFTTLRLELKSEAGDQLISVHMKDSTDPDDGSQANVEVAITDQWQVYELDLAVFKNADLSHLHLPIGFLFDDETRAFSIRTIEFIDAE